MTDPGSLTSVCASIDWSSILDAFIDDRACIQKIAPLGSGNINDTFLVTRKALPALVVQRINQRVFPDPICVAANVALVSDYLRARRSMALPASARLRFPGVIKTIDGKICHQDQDGSIWRCLNYIDKTVSYQHLIDKNQAAEVGKVLGSFHSLLSDFDTAQLCEPLPGFHDLQRYRDRYLKVIGAHSHQTGSAFDYCKEMVEERLDTADLVSLAQKEQAGRTVVHGDPKFDNFLFDCDSGRAVSLIDLDTVSSGWIAMDLGDCLRSLGNTAGEKGVESKVSFDIDVARLLLDGYRRKALLSESDLNLIYQGVRLLTYELGLRFFSDYLAGDRYFKVSRRDENLHRAVIQFRLLESIEKQRSALEAAVGFR